MLDDLFPNKLITPNVDDTVVAKGAAIMARKLCIPDRKVSAQERALTVTQVIASSISFCEEGKHDRMEPLIDHSNQLPLDKAKIFETKKDNQKTIKIDYRQG